VAAGADGAEAVLKRCGVLHAPVDIYAMARRLGVTVTDDPALAGLAYLGTTTVLGPKAEIRVRASEPVRRRRFMVAHALGHLLLHCDGRSYSRFVDETLTGDGTEREANAFAADLLMPLWMLVPAWERGWSPADLATIFDVSEAAINVRLRYCTRRVKEDWSTEVV
jgi:hypothetical protein